MALKKYFALSIIAASVAMSACSSDDDDDGGETTGAVDAGGVDAGGVDAGGVDAGGVDAGGVDAGGVDAGGVDAGGVDAGGVDAGGEDGMTDGMEEDLRPDPVTYTPEGNSIIDVARGTDADGDGTFEGGAAPLSILVDVLLPYGDLVDLLDDPDGSFTVFAPNNAAFADVDVAALGDAAVRRTLSYHVVPTPEDGMPLNTSALGEDQALPQTLDTAVPGTQLTVRDNGTGTIVVVDSDDSEIAIGEAVVAGNGVVYIINEVLTPPAEEGMNGEDGGDDSTAGTDGDGGEDGTGGAPAGTALAAIEADGELSAFEGILAQTGFTANLSDEDGGSDNYITFAPTNTALEGVTVADADAARAIVLQHIYVAPNDGDTLSPGDTFRTTGATAVDVTVGGTADALTVNGFPATLVTSGGSGGAVYKIEGVLQ